MKKALRKKVVRILGFDPMAYLEWMEDVFFRIPEAPIYPEIPENYFMTKFEKNNDPKILKFEKEKQAHNDEIEIYNKKYRKEIEFKNVWRKIEAMGNDSGELITYGQLITLNTILKHNVLGKKNDVTERLESKIVSSEIFITQEIANNLELIDFDLIEWCSNSYPLLKRQYNTAISTFCAIEVIVYLNEKEQDLRTETSPSKKGLNLPRKYACFMN